MTAQKVMHTKHIWHTRYRCDQALFYPVLPADGDGNMGSLLLSLQGGES